MTDKRQLIKNALCLTIPAAFAGKLMAEGSPVEPQNRILAILTAEFNKLKKWRPGLMTGETIPAGIVGEVQRIALADSGLTTAPGVFVDSNTFSVPAGVYVIDIHAECQIRTNSPNSTPAVGIALRTAENSIIEQSVYSYPKIESGTYGFAQKYTLSTVINSATPNRYKVSIQSNNPGYQAQILPDRRQDGGMNGLTSSFILLRRIA